MVLGESAEMSLKFSQIHAAMAAKINTLAGFKQARFPVEYFGRTSNPLAHLGYAIGIQSTQANGNRQPTTGSGMEVFSTIEVIFAYRLRPTDAYPTDYKNALDKEEIVTMKLLETYPTTPQLQLRYISTSRELPESLEYSIHRIEYQALHYLKA